ncbi:MAG: class I SAM-dependent methyltransferase [Thermodesulfobacteria bacterium]|nr:class I SAM-dependent methyltransferase [Thermodesulfobacteriota bacterium]
MQRIPEPELMLDEEQARAYAEADFAAPHQMFVDLFKKHFGEELEGVVLDLGCGPADICVRFARAFPNCEIHGLDGSPAMLKYGRARLEKEGLASRIKLLLGRIPEANLPAAFYDAVIVNSLLHHLPDPSILWETIKKVAKKGAPVLVMDLLRPKTPEEARLIVERYAASEPEVLKRDFYHSLLAAFTLEEVRQQLEEAGLSHFKTETVTDRHWIAFGKIC